jgi:protein-disulfide isomerase
MNKTKLAAALSAALFSCALSAQTESSGITKDQAQQILQELAAIRSSIAMLPHGEAPKKDPIITKLDLNNLPMLGAKHAPVTLVEFTDYQCSYCRQFHMSTFPLFKHVYIDSGRVRFYSLDLPLSSLHPDATRAAQAAWCAGDQGRYWEMRDSAQAHSDKLDLDNLVVAAAGLKVNAKAFRSCVESGKYEKVVRASAEYALGIGATGTPSFVLGRSTAGGTEGELIEGALPYVDFIRAIAKLEPVDPKEGAR